MKQAKKLESVKNNMFAVKTTKTVMGGGQFNGTKEVVNGKIKWFNDGM